MKIVKAGSIVIGDGVPKIITPLTGRTEPELMLEVDALENSACDIVEWRVDFFDGGLDEWSVVETGLKLKRLLTKPLLMTLRTKREGGQKEFSVDQYYAICSAVLTEKVADLIDVELFAPRSVTSSLLRQAHKRGVVVIMSNHDFEKTPTKEEIIYRLQQMQGMGADICKIAVTPHTPKDVLTLMEATEEMYRRHANCPLITMSMGSLGKITRVAGQLFGSAASFASGRKASAPGQLPVDELRTLLETFHR